MELLKDLIDSIRSFYKIKKIILGEEQLDGDIKKWNKAFRIMQIIQLLIVSFL